jgi:hypothetical protein
VVFDEPVDVEDIRSIAASPDGSKVYVPVGDRVRIFRVPDFRLSGEVDGLLPGRANFLSGLTGNDGGVYFCAGSSLIRIDPTSDSLSVLHTFPAPCAALAQAPDGTLYTSATGILYRVRLDPAQP